MNSPRLTVTVVRENVGARRIPAGRRRCTDRSIAGGARNRRRPASRADGNAGAETTNGELAARHGGHAVAGCLTRSWPMADPAVTISTLVPRTPIGNAEFSRPVRRELGPWRAELLARDLREQGAQRRGRRGERATGQSRSAGTTGSPSVQYHLRASTQSYRRAAMRSRRRTVLAVRGSVRVSMRCSRMFGCAPRGPACRR
jgi:hypothetical protein